MGRKSLALGRSLSDILQDKKSKDINELIISENKKQGLSVLKVDLDLIDPNPFQPRTVFNEESIIELAETIKEHGLIQPVTLIKFENRFQIVSGERRVRASKIAGFTQIDAYVHELLSDKNMGEWALIENIQRVDLNPIEIAQSYQLLIESHGYTHEDLAKSVGKSRSAITNAIRLLKLPETVQTWVQEGKLSSGAARALLSPDISDPEKLAKEIIEKGLNVRETEALRKGKSIPKEATPLSADMLQFVKQLTDFFGTKVSIKSKDKDYSKGTITIDYYSIEDLNRIQEIMDR
ncbi:MAG: ParB/RepB/Spo0J family partition protein [Fibrobacter sp.]|nr:ParB/RepB/Spo0J family partition protein [Fibrobacter sp.]